MRLCLSPIHHSKAIPKKPKGAFGKEKKKKKESEYVYPNQTTKSGGERETHKRNNADGYAEDRAERVVLVG